MTQPTLWPPSLEPFLSLSVPGKPAPQGSITLWRAADGSERAKHPTSTVAHRNLMVGMLGEVWTLPPLVCPVSVRLRFVFPFLRKHYRTGRHAHQLRDDAPAIHDTTPDLDKLVRLVFDALTVAGVWRDDCQACDVSAAKRWGTTGATHIYLRKATQ